MFYTYIKSENSKRITYESVAGAGAGDKKKKGSQILQSKNGNEWGP